MNDELKPDTISRLRQIFAQIPYAQFLGMELVAIARGAATVQLEARAELSRMEGIMHGGAIASLADTAAAFAVLSVLEEGQRTVTVDLTLHYLRPLTQGRITATARVLRQGRRLATVSIEVTDESGKLAATGITVYAKI